MQEKRFISVTSLFILLGTVVLLSSCSKKQSAANRTDSAIVEEISSFRLGRLTPVIVRFTHSPLSLPEKALTLSPAQKGIWSLRDERTAVFTPAVPYKAGSRITLSADCGKLFGKEFTSKNFEHTFIVDNPSYSVSFDGLSVNEAGNGFVLSGSLSTDIPLSKKEVDKILSVKLSGTAFSKKLPVEWNSTDKTDIRRFSVSGIEKYKSGRTLTVSWNGKQLGLEKDQDTLFRGSKTYRIPAQELFTVMDIDTSRPDTILVSFSEPVDTTQDIASFFMTEKRSGVEAVKVSYTVHKNIVNLYNDKNWQDISQLTIIKGIKSTGGTYLASQEKIVLSDTWDIPSVRFLTDGNILPSSQGTMIPVETKNLTGLSIQVYEIYNSNIVQFLQVNDLDGQEELYRVGEPVWTENITFPWDNSMQNKYIPRGIDLSELITKYPDGMFQIRITFRHENIKYVCLAGHRDFSSLPMPPDFAADEKPQEKSSWDYWEGVSWQDREDFWTYANDPCHPAFYMEDYNSSNFIRRNVLVSDIGIMAKKTAGDDLYVTVTDLKTAKPLHGATVTAYSFVGKQIQTAPSDADGRVIVKNSGRVAFIAATANKQSSYLKLSQGTALSVSHFETGGEIVQNGLKGYIYGERGVWRPGDPLYLTFVVQDLAKKLPPDIPVFFELQDPLGRITDTKTFTSGVNGFYAITTKTADDAPTGLWTARVTIGGQQWTKALRIEAVVPNHLSVKLETTQKYLTPHDNYFVLTGAWLHGAPTPDYKADVAVSISPAVTGFDGYSDYSFTNPVRTVETARETVWEGNLDETSKAGFSVSLPSDTELPGKLKAQFTTRVFEPSGMFSTEQQSFDYSPYTRYTGLRLPKGDAARGMLLTDVNHTADVVLLTPDGKPAGTATLSYTIYKIGWKWWWEKDALTDAAYVESNSYEHIAGGTVAVKNGKGSFTFMVKYPDWGRYMVVVSDGDTGHSAAKIVYIDWPGWAGRAQESGSGSAAMVPLVCDRQNYTAGDTAAVSFASGAGARALVTVEKSGEIIEQKWLETEKDTTVFKLPLTSAMAPNVYVHVTLLQPHLQTANSLPVRLYGVVPVLVDDPATKLNPVIDMPSEYAPDTKATLTVSEKNSSPMTFTVAVVDEGLLGLTNFKSPLLRNEFYKKETSELENWDLFNYVMNAYSGKLETLLAVGGSEEIIDNRKKSAMRFAPVVKYFGPYVLKAGEKKTITFDMPQYVGAVRAVVVAGNNGAYGSAEKTVPVKSDLMVLPSIPRTLGTNETIDIPITVFNGSERAVSVPVSFTARGACDLALSKTVDVPAGDNTNVIFRVPTKGAGAVVFDVSASAGQLSARSSATVSVVSRGVPVTFRDRFIVAPGAEYKASAETPGDTSSAKVSVELSPFPVLDLSSRLRYLITYPHGCIEQITSGGFPQLYIPGFVKLTPKETDDVKRNIQSVIERYPQYQTSSGGFGYWPGNSEPSEWGSCYGAHFLLEAEKAGYSIPDSIIGPLLDWIAKSAASWGPSEYSDSDVQAYKLFVLAEASNPDIGAMNRLMSENLSSNAKMLLAAAYERSGRPSAANDLFSQADRNPDNYRMTGGSFGSTLRDTAVMLYVSSLLGNDRKSAQLAKTVAEQLASGQWYSTQETAWSLMAVLPYYKGQTGGTCAYTAGNTSGMVQGTVTGGSVIETLIPEAGMQQTAVIKNTGDKTIYGTLTSSGMSAPGTEKNEDEGLALTVTYYGADGDRISPAKIKTGDSFRMDVRVQNRTSAKVENIALTIPVPTCWEFSNDRVGVTDREADESENSNSSYSNQDIRDQAIYTYFDLGSDGTFEYTFYATAAFAGDYYIPAVHAEAMYDDTIRAMIQGVHVTSF
jgi:alpha-2-macroglobulin